ncbi:MAG: hypothetical protein K2M55_04520 [Muribaculaceae bacterium]|nr:hypothetical protein [Muribaculaceae bacterium]
MKITSEQIAILDSFRVTRLKDDESLLRIVSAFKNTKNENLVEYLVGEAFDDDDKNRCACYVVRDADDDILCYFSIKCGLLYSEFEELKKFEKFKNHKIKLMELEQRSDNAKVREYIADIKKKLREAKDDIERLLGNFESLPPNKQVAKSFPSIELTHFCVNETYREKWQTYGFSARNRIGTTMFWHVIVGIIERIRNLTGCEYLYLFAADATSDRHLVNHYKNMMELREEMTMSALQPIYDFNCTFLCADISSLLNARVEFYNDFNVNEEIV